MFASAKLTNPKRLQKTISELEASSASRSHSLSISLCVPRCSRGRILSALHFFFFFLFFQHLIWLVLSWALPSYLLLSGCLASLIPPPFMRPFSTICSLCFRAICLRGLLWIHRRHLAAHEPTAHSPHTSCILMPWLFYFLFFIFRSRLSGPPQGTSDTLALLM